MPSRQELQQAIETLEAQRGLLDDDVVETSLQALRRQLQALEGQPATTLLHAVLSSNHSTTDSTAAGQMLSALYAMQMRLKTVAIELGATIDPEAGYDILARFEGDSSNEAAERAVEAALTMQGEMQAHNTQQRSSRKHFRVHVGIHSLDVHTVPSGDALLRRITNAIMEEAPPNGVLISHQTFQLVRGKFVIHHARPILSDAVAGPLRTYEVSRARVLPQSVQSDEIAGVRTRLVGRVTELRRLQDTLRQVITERQAQVLTIIGEGGVGKSRLILEYLRWLDMIPEGIWLFYGQAMPASRQQAYGLLQHIITTRFEIDQGDSLVNAQDKLVRGFVEHLGQSNAYKAHFIGHLIGFDFSKSNYLQGIIHDSRQIRDCAFNYLGQYLETLAHNNDYPLVFVLEDIQWADDGSLELLSYLLHNLSHLPLLIVATARPDLEAVHPDWGINLPHYSEMELPPLSDRATKLLIAEILRNVTELPRELQRMIAAQAAGNPYYVWELIRLLIEDQIITPQPDHWQLDRDRLADMQTLPSLLEIMQARAQLLPDESLSILQRAAVIGTTFWDRAVVDLAKDEDRADPEQILTRLQSMAHQNLIIAQRHSSFADTVEYQFSHTMLQQMIYEQIPAADRVYYHARAATWLIGRSMDRIGHYAAVIADHYNAANETQRAVKWYGMAGKQAQDTYAPQMAIRHYQKALDLMHDRSTDVAQGTSLLKGLGYTLSLQTRYAESIEAYETLIELATDVIDKAHAWNSLSTIHSRIGDQRAALEAAVQAETLALRAGSSVEDELARAWMCQCKAWLRLGDHQRATSLAHQALNLSTKIQNRNLIADGFNVMGSIMMSVEGNFEMAMTYFNKALELARESGNRRHEGALSNNIAEVARARGDYQTALVMFQEAEKVAVETGSRRGEIVTVCNISAAWLGLGEYKAAAKNILRILPDVETVGLVEQLIEALQLLAEAQVGLGEIDDALKTARRALSVAQRNDVHVKSGAVWRVFGKAKAQTSTPLNIDGHEYTAAACFDQSLRIYNDMGLETEQALTLQAWAYYELTQGDRSKGWSMWHEAIKRFTHMGADYHVQRMKAQLPTLDLASDD